MVEKLIIFLAIMVLYVVVDLAVTYRRKANELNEKVTHYEALVKAGHEYIEALLIERKDMAEKIRLISEINDLQDKKIKSIEGYVDKLKERPLEEEKNID